MAMGPTDWACTSGCIIVPSPNRASPVRQPPFPRSRAAPSAMHNAAAPHMCVDGVLTCVETLSEPAQHRRFGRTASNQRTVIAVTSRYLVWASADETEGAVAAARLSEIETREYRSTLIEDTGLDVVGFRLGATERESWFLPIDEGADGRDFRSQLQRAIAVASGHH